MTVDEVHMVGDGSRGATLESALSKLMASGHGPQIVAMSATSERGEWGAGRFEGHRCLDRRTCNFWVKRARVVMRFFV